MSQVFTVPPPSTCTSSTRAGAADARAFASALRSGGISPPRAIAASVCVGAPGAGRRKSPVSPRNSRMFIAASTSTPGGA